MMGSIAKDISVDGPKPWLGYFENTPSFFMAADGKLAFANYDSAASFINNTLVKNIKTIKLQWGGIRIDSIAPTLAVIAAGYHEDVTGFSGTRVPYDGYFTATANYTVLGWKLRNLHGSRAVGK